MGCHQSHAHFQPEEIIAKLYIFVSRNLIFDFHHFEVIFVRGNRCSNVIILAQKFVLCKLTCSLRSPSDNTSSLPWCCSSSQFQENIVSPVDSCSAFAAPTLSSPVAPWTCAYRFLTPFWRAKLTSLPFRLSKSTCHCYCLCSSWLFANSCHCSSLRCIST